MSPIAERNSRTRVDIQVLRGFAVLVVLVYHAKLSAVNAGYLGVDVFFVLSGFLMTRVVKGGLERGNFSFREFYFRRAKRLLPAAYTVFLVTALMAPIFLTSVELRDFCAQMLGAVTFTANIVLWRQAGYFGGAATLKPLLHVWSLSLEEQYYFVLPAAMYFTSRRLWKPITLAAVSLSFLLCLFMVSKTAAAFYLLPSRGWELAIGSLGALITLDARSRALIGFLFWPALACLISLSVRTIFPYHPGPDALIICVATLIIVLREHPILSTGFVTRGMAGIGDISYSLYLVHWPLFAFLNNSFIGAGSVADAPLAWRIGVVAVSIVLAFLLNKYIEEPAHRANIPFRPAIVLHGALASIALVFITFVVARLGSSGESFQTNRQANEGMSRACDFRGAFSPIAQCETSKEPLILVWGDSFAMHLVPGLLREAGPSAAMIQATRGECGPLLYIAPIEKVFSAGADKSWAERCIAFNDSVLRYLSQSASVQVVVLSSPFKQYLEAREFRLLYRDEHGAYRQVDAGNVPALQSLKATVDAVRRLGKRVVVVAPPPQAGFDVGRCLERVEKNMFTIDAVGKCDIGLESISKDSSSVNDFLSQLPAFANVEVIDLKEHLCHADTCETSMDDVPLYVDSGHLSREGSIRIAAKIHLLNRVLKEAR